MTDIIVSVSGIRGITGDNLTPESIVKFVSAYCKYCKKYSRGRKKIVIGRDGRMGGNLIGQISYGTIAMSGFEVVNIGVAPTPTVQIATEELNAAGGISITASHNPQEWNGLKMLNSDGTFFNARKMEALLKIFENNDFSYENYRRLRNIANDDSWLTKHIERVLALEILDVNKIRKRNLKIVVDAVNASGSEVVPDLLKRLGCRVTKLYCNSSGEFPHKPEPLPENLKDLSAAVVRNSADIGIAVDPDADRLVMITDTGEPFGEENTITAVTNFVLKKNNGRNKNVTVNLSTTRGVDDVAMRYGAKVFRSPVGEINVVDEMKRNHSIIGGEGSGGVIYPELHYGRDSLAGIALMLNEIADYGGKLSEYKKTLPQYSIAKTKIEKIDNASDVLNRVKNKVSKESETVRITTTDGLKIDFKNSWVHLRKSNTEPIIRVIAEAPDKHEAAKLVSTFVSLIAKLKK